MVNSVALTENEIKALAIAGDRKALREEFKYAISVLRQDRYGRFFQRQYQRFAFEEKRLYGTGGFYLQWLVRSNPELPESYENQQTNRGMIRLLSLPCTCPSKQNFELPHVDVCCPIHGTRATYPEMVKPVDAFLKESEL